MVTILLQQERWICQNSACGSEMVVSKPSEITTAGLPRCRCGSVMKKFYTAPAFTHLKTSEAQSLFRDPDPNGRPLRGNNKSK